MSTSESMIRVLRAAQRGEPITGTDIDEALAYAASDLEAAVVREADPTSGWALIYGRYAAALRAAADERRGTAWGTA